LDVFKNTPTYRLSVFEANLQSLRSDVETLTNRVTSLETAQQSTSPALTHLQESIEKTIRTEAVSAVRRANEVENLRNALREVRELAEPAGWSSAVIREFPKLFEDFKKKQFTLLWRGSRDGFDADEFHRRCGGHPNTLTVILDTAGNIFGGFTPVEWESPRKEMFKGDTSLTSFLFTLNNPHNFPARRFVLKAEKKDEAICCDSDWGPHFHDIGVFDNCNTNSHSRTYTCCANTKSFTQFFGDNYTNDTGLNRKTFFTGSEYFRVKEIEVFEIGN
jgi:hypothetical protein